MKRTYLAASGFQNTKYGSSLPSCPPEESDKAAAQSNKSNTTSTHYINCSLFFDGTNNNKFNTEAREYYQVSTSKIEVTPTDKAKQTIRKLFSTQKKFEDTPHNAVTKGSVYSNDTEGTSYSNALTNVALLYRELMDGVKHDEFDKKTKSFLKLYIDGIGTTEGEEDSLAGLALGVSNPFSGNGNTGIKSRAEQALHKLKGAINIEIKKQYANVVKDNLCDDTKMLKVEININVFGFSRGAATARYFIYILLNTIRGGNDRLGQYTISESLEDYSRETTRAYGNPDVIVKAKFAGLFDTVASFGLTAVALERSNTEDLHLDAIANAEKAIHICALDEHRVNFPLTNIESRGGDEEYFFPGVHSDIGGSYNNDETEEAWVASKSFGDESSADIYASSIVGDSLVSQVDRITRAEEEFQAFKKKECDWLLDVGWAINEQEIKCYPKKSPLGQIKCDIFLIRKNVSNLYSRVSLHFMKEKAKSFGLKFWPTIDNKHDCGITQLPKELSSLFYITMGMQANMGKASADSFWNDLNKSLTKKLRNKYFHFSAQYDNGTGKNIIKKNYPRIINGVRERKIHKG